MKKESVKYSNIIYAFDIETTTTDEITSIYLSSFISVDFNTYMHDNDSILDSMTPAHFCRSSEEVNDYLVKLSARQKIEKEHIIIYCHNLAYEFDYLIKNVDFVKDNFNNADALFIKPRIPLFFRVGYIEFRCSYRLLNAPLRSIGDNLGYPKLEIDYQRKFYSFSKLPDIEYEYNERDVRLTLLGVLKECSKWSYIHFVKDIPLTSTGFTRTNNKKINTAKDRKNYAGFCSYQKRFSKEYVEFLEHTFSGGYTHANALYVNRPLKNVASFDIVSSYIDTILHRKYPRFFKKYYGTYGLKFFLHLSSLNTDNYMDVINNYASPFAFSFMAHITLRNVKPIIRKRNLILPISASKCDFVAGIELDNGRIYTAKLLKLNVTEVDYFIIQQFYSFEVVNCDKMYYTRFHAELMPFVTNSTREYLHEKSTLKPIVDKVKNGKRIGKSDFYCAKKGEYIYSDAQINAILAMSPDKRKKTIKDNYSRSKEKLNAQYGINVQKLLSPRIAYDRVNDLFINEIDDGVTAKVLYRDFTNGLYITAYSRLNLFCYGLYMIERCDARLIYSDTDSWKISGDIHKAVKVNEEYNRYIEGIVHNSEDYDVGTFDYEELYQNFATLGCKKYVVSDGKKITCTIAGVNKIATSEAYTELYKSLNYDFDIFCKVAFSPCTILASSITTKLITLYHSNDYIINVTDENGDSGTLAGTNMVELAPSDYVLMDYDKGTVNEYIQYFSKLQNTIVDYIPTYIYRDTDGIVKYKYITNWKEALHVLRGINVDFININI